MRRVGLDGARVRGRSVIGGAWSLAAMPSRGPATIGATSARRAAVAPPIGGYNSGDT